jgi:hypothetical protein
VTHASLGMAVLLQLFRDSCCQQIDIVGVQAQNLGSCGSGILGIIEDDRRTAVQILGIRRMPCIVPDIHYPIAEMATAHVCAVDVFYGFANAWKGAEVPEVSHVRADTNHGGDEAINLLDH